MSPAPLPDETSTDLADLDPNPLVILGEDRRILYANPAARALSAPDNSDRVEGLKLGELLRCIHSLEPEGCGDTPACLYCGANRGIRRSLEENSPSISECHITSYAPGGDCSAEFSIQSRPVEWQGEAAVFCALNDISHEKRRRVLERIFFHDILNTAGSVKGLSEMLLMERHGSDDAELAESLKMMRDCCDLMLDEIRSQQVLLAAESGQLSTSWQSVAIADCMADAAMVASHLPAAAKRTIVPVYPGGRPMFLSDPVLLGRVLMNLLKNALEAAEPGEEIRLTGRQVEDHVEFTVWNSGVVFPATRLQLFQRSFSTKGAGRGTGTYSVRLLTEGYLKGKVSFTSSQQDGTTFTILLPVKPPAHSPAAG